MGFDDSRETEARQYREDMVDYQLAARNITDQRVLDAFRTVPRHRFCPPSTPLSEAYADHPLPIGDGQTISQPFMVADMTQRMELKGTEKILEIGTGSGYQAAILALLAREVHSVERIEPLAQTAEQHLRGLHCENVHIHLGDGTQGWPAEAPYDAIIVTAAAPDVPQPLKMQLTDGGRLVIPVGPHHIQQLLVLKRLGDDFEEHSCEGCCFVPLIGKNGWPE
ncbi:MAG: protein-L-isoaspartate(D-aspartate) O-methyltransferase [Candidatus Pacebacteria bacterium]|nr:protein-L-isoaspartate(D-aspartate) O-methyltransferase [Candidatus Paceibacterota bacterium]